MVERAIRRVQGTKWLALGLVASLLYVVGVLGVAFYLRTASSQQNCEAINSDRSILRGILERSEQVSLAHAHPGFTTAQITAFYGRSLSDLADQKC